MKIKWGGRSGDWWGIIAKSREGNFLSRENFYFCITLPELGKETSSQTIFLFLFFLAAFCEEIFLPGKILFKTKKSTVLGKHPWTCYLVTRMRSFIHRTGLLYLESIKLDCKSYIVTVIGILHNYYTQCIYINVVMWDTYIDKYIYYTHGSLYSYV